MSKRIRRKNERNRARHNRRYIKSEKKRFLNTGEKLKYLLKTLKMPIPKFLNEMIEEVEKTCN